MVESGHTNIKGMELQECYILFYEGVQKDDREDLEQASTEEIECEQL